jgi:O-antigen/teichoic acid export membrane protein
MPPAVVSARSVAVGGAWTVAGRTIPLLYTFVISIAAARILGPVAMGRLALVVFAASTVIAVLSLGVAGALVRFIGESLGRGESDAARLLVRWAATLAVVGAVVSIAVFAIVAATVPTVAAAWLFAGIWVAATLIHAVPSVLLSGAQRWRQAVIVGLTTGSIHVAASLIALWAGGGVAELVAIDAAIAILNVIGTVWIARGELRRWSPVTASTRDLRLGRHGGPGAQLRVRAPRRDRVPRALLGGRRDRALRDPLLRRRGAGAGALRTGNRHVHGVRHAPRRR